LLKIKEKLLPQIVKAHNDLKSSPTKINTDVSRFCNIESAIVTCVLSSFKSVDI